jgi:hypothetical protein
MVDPHIFGPFVRMLQRLPAKAIGQALELEYRMLLNDLQFNRYTLTEEAQSILCFRRFIQTAKFGGTMYFATAFSLEHYEFYKQTIIRLIEADELPSEALGEFDQLFAPPRFSLAA